MTKKLNDALKKQKKSTQQAPLQLTGTLGLPIGGERRVEVPNRNGFVYVKLRDNQSEVIQAFNNKVSPSYGLPVIVERHNNRYVVVSVDSVRYQNNWPSFASFLPRHGNTHSFDTDSGGGGDVVWVHGRQFFPALIVPSGSSGAPNVLLSPYTARNVNGTWKYVGLTGTQDLTPHRPTGSSAVMVLIYLDSVSGNPYLLVGSGTYFDASITGANAVYRYIPTLPDPNHVPLAAVRLVTGTTIIGWDNIYDVRQFIHTIPTGTGGGTNITIQDEGVSQGIATTFNFVGENVSASIAGGTVRVFVTGSVGGGVGSGTFVNIQDEGVPKGTVSTFNFVGNNVDASVSGSVVRVFVTGSTSGSSFTGISGGIVLTDSAGALTTNVKIKYQLIGGRLAAWFGSDEVGQEANANRLGTKLFDEYFDIIGAGTGVGQRTVQIYDILRTPALTIPGLANNLIRADSNGTFISGEAPLTSGSYGRMNRDWAQVVPSDGWIYSQSIWTFSSSDDPVFVASVNTDVSNVLNVGDRIKLSQSATIKYFIVVAIGAWSGSATLVTLYGGTDYDLTSAVMLNVQYSHEKSPVGFPLDPSKWTVEVSSAADRTKSTPTQNTWYGQGNTMNGSTTILSIDIPIGAWYVGYFCYIYCEIAGTSANVFSTLSTNTTAESDNDFTSAVGGTLGGITTYQALMPGIREKVLTLASKTTYYTLVRTTATGLTLIGTLGSTISATRIRARCAYL